MVIFSTSDGLAAVASITRYIRNVIRQSSAKNRCKDAEPPSRLEPIQRSRKLSCLYRMSGESK
jgi:hypothetical protein